MVTELDITKTSIEDATRRLDDHAARLNRAMGKAEQAMDAYEAVRDWPALSPYDTDKRALVNALHRAATEAVDAAEQLAREDPW